MIGRVVRFVKSVALYPIKLFLRLTRAYVFALAFAIPLLVVVLLNNYVAYGLGISPNQATLLIFFPVILFFGSVVLWCFITPFLTLSQTFRRQYLQIDQRFFYPQTLRDHIFGIFIISLNSLALRTEEKNLKELRLKKAKKQIFSSLSPYRYLIDEVGRECLTEFQQEIKSTNVFQRQTYLDNDGERLQGRIDQKLQEALVQLSALKSSKGPDK